MTQKIQQFLGLTVVYEAQTYRPRLGSGRDLSDVVLMLMWYNSELQALALYRAQKNFF